MFPVPFQKGNAVQRQHIFKVTDWRVASWNPTNFTNARSSSKILNYLLLSLNKLQWIQASAKEEKSYKVKEFAQVLSVPKW